MVCWMESERKRIDIKRVNSYIKRITSNRRRFREYLLTVILLLISMVTYLFLTKKEAPSSKSNYSISSNVVNDAVNNYRLENFDRAEILFTTILNKSKKKKLKNLSAFYLGNIYFFRDNYRTAIGFYKESLKYDKSDVHAIYNMALSYSRDGEIRHAINYVLKALELDKNFFPGLLLLGNIYYAEGSYDNAIEIYQSHSNDIFKYNLAVSYLRKGEKAECIELLEDLANKPNTDEAIRGMSFYSLGVLKNEKDLESVDYFKKALMVFPSNPILKYNLLVKLIKEKNYSEAIPLIKSVDVESGGDKLGRILSEALFRSGSYNHALDIYLDVYRRTKDSKIAYIIGDIYLKLDNIEKAKYYYQIAVDAKKYSTAYINLINIYIREGNTKKAIGVCNDLISTDKENPKLYLCMANIYFKLNDVPNARKYLGLAVGYANNDPYTLLKIASIFKKHEFYNNAHELYDRVLKLKPDFYSVYLNMAATYYKSGHYERAKKVLEMISERIDDIDLYYRAKIFLANLEVENKILIYRSLINDFPYRYEAYYNLSLVYISNKDYDSAREVANSCLRNVAIEDKSVLSLFYSILAISDQELGEIRKAYKEYNTALDLDGANEIPKVNLKLLGEE